MKRGLWLVIGISAIVLFIIVAFLFLVLAKPKYAKNILEKPAVSVSESSVAYILNEIGAYSLHSEPGSGENPVIEIRVDSENFSAEIVKGNIRVTKENSYMPDLRIITSSDEVIGALEAASAKDYIKSSVASGKTGIELVASYPKLFFKGYLSIYRELTGKSFTGAVVRVFGQG